MLKDKKAVWTKIAKVSHNVPQTGEKETKKESLIIVASHKNFELHKKMV